MDRVYEYEDAKRLCASHKKILELIQKINASRAKDAERVKKNASEVLRSKVIASEITTALQTGNINPAEQPNEKALMHAIYVYDEGQKILSEMNRDEKVRKDIIRDIERLSSLDSPLKRFFTTRQVKEEANNAYERLAFILQSNYPVTMMELEKRNKKLDEGSANEFIATVAKYGPYYYQCLSRFDPNLVKKDGLSSDISQKIRTVSDLANLYRRAMEDQKFRENQARSQADNAINPLIMEKTLQELRNQDLDVLSQKRSGIRIKALRDHGYRNIADLYAATQYQLASVYGISADAARVIKAATNEIARDVAKTIKLKISSDEKTPAASALLKAAYKYERIKKAGKSISPSIRGKLDDAVKKTIVLGDLTNNLGWVFADAEKRKSYVQAYQSLDSCLTPETVSAVQQFINDVQSDLPISDAYIWADFNQRSIEYFNLLEDLCPGAFGNDDTLYGLPEDLAREIQDQVYFPQGLKVSLRRYQEWGVKYILHQGRVLLGDEMGLGKTVQAIATMVSLRNTGAKKFLVVCPASVLPNWCKEIDKKSEFQSIKVHGPGRQAAFDSWNKKGGVAVTTYETLSALRIPAGLEYDLLIVDEAHFIKNENAQRSQYVRMYGTYTKRLLYMTGTALENKVEEMISLLQVLNPGVAAQAQKIAFMSTAPQFRQMVAPVYYRRKREDVLTELPAITNSNEWCDLLPEEYDAYRKAVMNKDRSAIRKVSWVTPDLNRSAKARRMKEIIEEAESDGRKVLVFSFYLETIDRVLELLGDRCTQPINGSVPVYRRQEIIDEFEKMPAGSVLPAQIQAGGTGLNIQSASVVIICEPQLKPSIENQAISRAYRMGQTRKVLVYRLLASDTIDERIDDMLQDKQAVFDAFADISEAANATQKEEQQIDDKTFGKLIQEEIDRINAQNGKAPSHQEHSQPAQPVKKMEQPSEKPAEPKPMSRMNSIYNAQGTNRSTTDQMFRPKPEPVENRYGTGSSSSPYKAQPMVKAPSQNTQAQTVNTQESRQNGRTNSAIDKTTAMNFTRLDDFLIFASGNGVMIKDNREKGGCIWVKADPKINSIIQNQVFGDRKFMYAAKSKTLGGEAGWYY